MNELNQTLFNISKSWKLIKGLIAVFQTTVSDLLKTSYCCSTRICFERMAESIYRLPQIIAR